uniref:DDE-1 domain-containing protein n=1 Tax=Daphnia galeata TaxID=27404 RepID=A0A8J2WGJ6_9CRUS|nr:unnamed protein product [Daphnia galeata]
MYELKSGRINDQEKPQSQFMCTRTFESRRAPRGKSRALQRDLSERGIVKILVLPARLFFLGRGATGVFWHTCVNGLIFSMLTCVLVEKTVDGEEDGDFEAASIDDNDESAVETASVDDEDDSSFVVWCYHICHVTRKRKVAKTPHNKELLHRAVGEDSTVKDTLHVGCYLLAKSNVLNIPHRVDKTYGKASEDWLAGFLIRNKSLSIRKPEQTSQAIARATGFNKPVVDSFYAKLQSLNTKNQFKANEVFNGDETSNATVMVPPNIIAAKGTKQVILKFFCERGTNVTKLAFINAAGGTVPSVFVYPRKKVLPAMFEKGPPGWASFVKSSKEIPVLLTLDNHTSHLDYQAVNFCERTRHNLVNIPPHYSHALQPCDVTVFGPLKKACGKSQNDWLHLHPGESISIKHIAELSTGPFQEAVTPKNIIAGFKAT